MNDRNENARAPAAEPWWRIKMVWLVIAGPLIVVVAGIATSVVAIRGGDKVVGADAEATPAMQARNHAASPRP
ncbi:hypothetical protein [Aquabacterium sp.]|uniref:hypothetical protein n=1 Tax=Aquabacterium sp. TaxID=1872578 RepID=UPI0037835F98